MHKILRKAPLLVIAGMLLGCSAKTAKNFLVANTKTIARNGQQTVRLSDPQQGYKYSIEFIPNQLEANISLGGGLSGKSIDQIGHSEDLHTVVLILSGNSNNSETEGTITIKSGAVKALTDEYQGFDFINTFTVADVN